MNHEMHEEPKKKKEMKKNKKKMMVDKNKLHEALGMGMYK